MNSARGPCAVLVRGEGTRPLETLHAKMLLGRTTWSVAQIADALGFTEPAHFSNFFRKHTDQSPMQFRAV